MSVTPQESAIDGTEMSSLVVVTGLRDVLVEFVLMVKKDASILSVESEASSFPSTETIPKYNPAVPETSNIVS